MPNTRRSTTIFTIAGVVMLAATLLRTLFFARHLSLEDFGIAASYLLLVTLVEMFAQMRPDVLMVQDRSGDEKRMQGALQAYQAARGVLAAAVLLAIAWPLAWSFDQIDNIDGYLVLAIVPILGGLAHFDQHRFKREMNLTPAAAVNCLPHIGSLVLAIALAPVITDHRLMLVAIVGQHAMALALSHLVARRRYRWCWDMAVFWRVTSFGAPFMVNGILLFFIMNGERWVIGNQLGMAAMAVFTLMLNLAMTPTLAVINTMQTWFLSKLSRLQDDAEAFASASLASQQASLAAAIAYAAAAVVFGPPLAALMTGEQYHDAIAIFAWLALVQAVRLARIGSVATAEAMGHTRISLAGNLVRLASLPIGLVWLMAEGTMIGLAVIGLIAEMIGYVIGLRLVRRWIGLQLRPILAPALISAGVGTLALFDIVTHPPQAGIADHAHPFQLVILAAAAGATLSMRAFWQLLRGR